MRFACLLFAATACGRLGFTEDRPGGIDARATQTDAPVGAEAMLVVTPIGNGVATIASDIPGIDCGATCTASFPIGTTVTLTATTANGNTLAYWGGACSGSAQCTVVVGGTSTTVVAATIATRTGATMIGPLAPTGVSTNGIQGIAFDGGADPLVVDGSGQKMWRVSATTGSATSTIALTGGATTTRQLAWNGTLRYTTRSNPSSLATVALDGTVTTIGGVMGQYNFLALAFDPAGVLWMLNDCANAACSFSGGVQLWRVNLATGAGTVVHDYTPLGLGDATGLAIDSDGAIYAATESTTGIANIYLLDPVGGSATPVAHPMLPASDLLNSMSFAAPHKLLVVDEQRAATPRAWRLVQIDL